MHASPVTESSPPNEWIHLESVSLVRNRRLILDAIDWTIEPDHHWAVLGANGSGKTTLLQLLAGYLWPTHGRITVLGERFGHTDLRELRKRIGWVGSFLEAQVPPAQKPLDLVVSGKYASIGVFETPNREDYERAREVAVQMGCGGILESPYGVLSQGEKQRLLIARALVNRPQLLILDEPCAGLDIVAREDLLHILETLGKGPDTPNMIFVTHHIEEIMPVFTHAFLLMGGRCLAKGEKRDMLRAPLLSRAFGIELEVVEEGERHLWLRRYSP